MTERRLPVLSRPGRGLLVLVLCLAVASASGCSAPERPERGRPADDVGAGFDAPYDPVTADPGDPDPDHLPAMEPVAIPSGDVPMNGHLYIAGGPGPHPTVVLLHGFPGNEKNLDLAQAIRRAGWNVLFFHYRGSWGSGGSYSFGNVLDDVDAALDFLAIPAVGVEHRVDPTRIVLVGHSLGGFAALMTAARRADVDGVVSIAGANMGLLADAVAEQPEMRQDVVASLDADTGPLEGTTGDDLLEELQAVGDDWDLRDHAEALADRPILLIAASGDELADPAVHHRPLVEALEEAGAERLDHMIIRGDHSFSPSRIALSQAVVGWLSREFDQESTDG